MKPNNKSYIAQIALFRFTCNIHTAKNTIFIWRKSRLLGLHARSTKQHIPILHSANYVFLSLHARSTKQSLQISYSAKLCFSGCVSSRQENGAGRGGDGRKKLKPNPPPNPYDSLCKSFQNQRQNHFAKGTPLEGRFGGSKNNKRGRITKCENFG